MAFSINVAFITGNVTRDPELKYTPSGTAVCSLGVATNYSMKKGDQWVDVPTFHNVVVWGKQAEFIANSVHKGVKVSVVGRIDNRQYEAKDGTKRYISEIVADTVVPFTPRPGTESSATSFSPPSDLKPEKIVETPTSTDQKVEDIVIPDEMPF
ncbi:single-stranded DNA-binding protein [Patescibacteria group bacterium]|nr:single-stranded DNA-binding protein [Patescibacteria group bacterium]